MNVLHVYRDSLRSIRLELPLGRSVAGAILRAPMPGYDRRGLAGALRQIGSLQISVRYPVLVGDRRAVAQMNRQLAEASASSAYFDFAWIVCSAVATVVNGVALGGKQHVAFLTYSQTLKLGDGLPIAVCSLTNGQVVTTVDPGPSGSSDRSGTMEMLPLRFSKEADALAPPLLKGEFSLQILPSQPYVDRFGSPHSHYCVLHPSRSKEFASGAVTVRNPALERAFPGFKARLPMLLSFDDRVSRDRVVLDETTAVAVGIRRGEEVAVRGLRIVRPDLWRRVLGLRHCLCRVVYASTVDMEKPIARVPEEVLDVLGLSSGSKIVVESVSDETGEPELKRTTLRILIERDGRKSLDSSRPDFYDVTGSVDLPIIALDFIARAQLGITPGAAVYVRPAVTGAIASEYLTLSLVLLAGTVTSIFSQYLLAAILLLLVYLVLAGTVLFQRLR